MFMVFIHNNQKLETTQIFINSRMGTQFWNIHKMKCNSAIKREKLLIFIPCLNLDSILLSKGRQTITRPILPFIWNSKKGKKYSDGKPISGCQGSVDGRRQLTSKVHMRTCWDEGNILYPDCSSNTIAIFLTKVMNSDTLKGQILQILKTMYWECVFTRSESIFWGKYNFLPSTVSGKVASMITETAVV